MTTLALTSGSLTTVGVVVTVVLVILGLLLGLLITKLIARAVIAVVVVVLAVLVWQQRDHVQSKVRQRCSTGASFFGVHVDPAQACDRLQTRS